MAFNPVKPREFVVADAFGGPNNTGAATAYRLAGGKVRLINGPVPDSQIAPCWMVITRDGRFAYTSNADSQSISGYRIHENGKISLLNANGVTGTTPADTFPIEEALSRNSRFLYVLDTRLLLTPPGPATLSGFRIRQNGRLTPVVDEAQIVLPFSAIGLAAE
jgi:6-phosphogluconolactonase (cycloisomerase 2 family)